MGISVYSARLYNQIKIGSFAAYLRYGYTIQEHLRLFGKAFATGRSNEQNGGEAIVSTAHSFKAPQLISIRPVFDTFQERFAPNRYIDSILVIV